MRVLSQEAGADVKQRGMENNLVDRIQRCQYFEPIHKELGSLLEPSSFIGRAPQQVRQQGNHMHNLFEFNIQTLGLSRLVMECIK